MNEDIDNVVAKGSKKGIMKRCSRLRAEKQE